MACVCIGEVSWPWFVCRCVGAVHISCAPAAFQRPSALSAGVLYSPSSTSTKLENRLVCMVVCLCLGLKSLRHCSCVSDIHASNFVDSYCFADKLDINSEKCLALLHWQAGKLDYCRHWESKCFSQELLMSLQFEVWDLNRKVMARHAGDWQCMHRSCSLVVFDNVLPCSCCHFDWLVLFESYWANTRLACLVVIFVFCD